MDDYQKAKAARNSLFKLFEAFTPTIQDEWDALYPDNTILLSFAVDEEPKAKPSILLTFDDEPIWNGGDMKTELFVRVDVLTPPDPDMMRFITIKIFEKIGLVSERNDREAKIPYNSYFPDPDSPILFGKLIVKTMGDMGWEKDTPGESGTPLKDASTLRRFTILIAQY